MAGHSKWANIKHRKGVQDAKRGKLFTKLIRELTVSAKQGADPDSNPRLRTAIDKALTCNMTRDTIDRAIKRGAGNDEVDNMEEVTYEGYGPGGVAVLVYCLTDNRNRTVSDVRHAFTKFGGNLGTDGSVAYLFNKCGQLLFDDLSQEEALTEVAIDAGAEDVIADEEGIEVRTSFEDFISVKEALQKAGFSPAQAEITCLPATSVELDEEKAESYLKMIEKLEDSDDVQNVYSNAELPDSVLE